MHLNEQWMEILVGQVVQNKITPCIIIYYRYGACNYDLMIVHE